MSRPPSVHLSVNHFNAGSPAGWMPPEESAAAAAPAPTPLPKIHQLVIRQDLAGLTVRRQRLSLSLCVSVGVR
jgi:hypothetical protein